jgi:hypothetical protein
MDRVLHKLEKRSAELGRFSATDPVEQCAVYQGAIRAREFVQERATLLARPRKVYGYDYPRYDAPNRK